MSDEAHKKAAVGRALGDLVPTEQTRRRVQLQARGNVALQRGAFVTQEQLDAQRARIVAVVDDLGSDEK